MVRMSEATVPLPLLVPLTADELAGLRADELLEVNAALLRDNLRVLLEVRAGRGELTELVVNAHRLAATEAALIQVAMRRAQDVALPPPLLEAVPEPAPRGARHRRPRVPRPRGVPGPGQGRLW